DDARDRFSRRTGDQPRLRRLAPVGQRTFRRPHRDSAPSAHRCALRRRQRSRRRKGPKEVCDDYKAFAQKIHAALPDARLIYLSIKPSPSRWNLRERIVQTNALIAAECAKDARETFLD